MKFNWFKRKEELTPEAVLQILKARDEEPTVEYKFGGYAYDLPITVADDDFLEYLEEESIFPGDSIEMVEITELFAIWMAENCQ